MLVPVLEETCFYVNINRFFKEFKNALRYNRRASFRTFITLTKVTCTTVVPYEIILYNTIWYSV